MALQIYNTMTRSKEMFESLEPGKVKVYVCGPTVYGYIHIGNARPMVFFDVVRRYLENQKYEVNFVVNFTDVDDKLIRKAEEMKLTVLEVADMYIQAYYDDLDGLGIPRATANPRVTEHMDIIIDFIAELERKGFAYVSGGDVYFRTGKFDEYGKLSGQNLEELQFGIRIQVDERKEHPEDFVLWKATKPGEIYWDSPWGKGRPGWHIECSAMSQHILGDTLDIHGGGQDLQFPHHECEVAQSEAMTGKPLAHYWMHNGYVNVDGEKMSKSLGNGVLVKDLREMYSKEAIRYFILSTHYRNPLNFTEDIMLQSQRGVDRLTNAANNLKHRIQEVDTNRVHQGEQVAIWADKMQMIQTQFHAKMQDDFNTADSISAMFEWATEVNVMLQQSDVHSKDLALAMEIFEEMNGVLRIVGESKAQLLDSDIEVLIEERVEARKAKNWARADEIRDQLDALGIVLEDTPQGIRWRRK